jgi:hypothetical protein
LHIAIASSSENSDEIFTDDEKAESIHIQKIQNYTSQGKTFDLIKLKKGNDRHLKPT